MRFFYLRNIDRPQKSVTSAEIDPLISDLSLLKSNLILDGERLKLLCLYTVLFSCQGRLNIYMLTWIKHAAAAWYLTRVSTAQYLVSFSCRPLHMSVIRGCHLTVWQTLTVKLCIQLNCFTYQGLESCNQKAGGQHHGNDMISSGRHHVFIWFV